MKLRFVFVFFAFAFYYDSVFATNCDSDGMSSFILNLNAEINNIVSKVGGKLFMPAIESVIKRNLNIGVISEFLMAGEYRRSSEQEKRDFAVQMEAYLARKYARYLADGIKGDLIVMKSKCESNSGGYVILRVEDSQNNFYTMQYNVEIHSGSYKINDVTVNGTSLLIALREEIVRFLRKSSMREYIATLTQQNLNSQV